MRFLASLAVLALAACSVYTQKLDELTGTTLEQRCADRRAFIAATDLSLSRGIEVSNEVMATYETYRAFVAAYCPVLPPAPAAPAG